MEQEEEVGYDSLDKKRKQKVVNENEEEQIIKKEKTYSYDGLGPEYAAYRKRVNNELRFINKWEWSDEDLLLSCQEYLLHQITKEDSLKELPLLCDYLKKKQLSQGFDVDVRRKIGIYPISTTEKQLQKYKDLAELDIESYNKENDKTNYEVIKVVKVNVCPDRCDWYYLTFIANDVSSRGRYRSPKTFQARVVVPAYQSEIPAEAKLCRLKLKY